MKQCFSLHKMCELYHICCFISQYPREVKVGLLPGKYIVVARIRVWSEFLFLIHSDSKTFAKHLRLYSVYSSMSMDYACVEQ